MDQCIPVFSQSTSCRQRTNIAVSWCTLGSPTRKCVGPILFLMKVNDIAEGVTSQMRTFVDDSIVYRQIQTPADHFTLASDLNKLLSWAKTWQMDFNVSKCAVYRLLPRGTCRPMITSWGTNKYHGLTIRTTWGIPSTQHYYDNHTSTKCRTKPAGHLAYSKEHCIRRHRK